jgi:hypothetical protein
LRSSPVDRAAWVEQRPSACISIPGRVPSALVHKRPAIRHNPHPARGCSLVVSQCGTEPVAYGRVVSYHTPGLRSR